MSGDVLRVLGFSDVAQAQRLSQAAGWNQTEDDWRRLFALTPDGCFGIEIEGALAATATVICYQSELAWIGMVLTAPEYRRLGFARRLMVHALEFLEARGVGCIRLDASEMGQPLYEQLGFVAECPIERWRREGMQGTTAAVVLPETEIDLLLDQRAFGSDRQGLLQKLAGVERAYVPGGHAFARPGSEAAYFGPCVAESAMAAEALVKWFAAKHGRERALWDLLPQNSGALDLARAHGYVLERRLLRMAYGPARRRLIGRISNIVAIAGFEYG